MSDCRVPMVTYKREPVPCRACGELPKLNKHKRCQGSLYAYMCVNPECAEDIATHWCNSEHEAAGAWNLLNAV